MLLPVMEFTSAGMQRTDIVLLKSRSIKTFWSRGQTSVWSFKSSLRFSVILFLMTGSRSVAWVNAQDRVTFTPAGTNSPVIAIGEVIESTGRELVLRTLNNTQRILPDSIIRIETTYHPDYLRGIDELKQGQVVAAQASLRGALEKEHRPWVQREIRSWLVKTSLRQQDLGGALHEFREIVLTDPRTRFWGIAPLVWSPLSVSESLRQEILPWLKSPQESERLLAASLLLLDPVHGEAAERVLEELSRNTNPLLSTYSRMQLWRLAIGSQNVSSIMQNHWREEIVRLRPELRSGPQYLLARGLAVNGEYRLAAAEALWLPYVYSDHELLAARALFDAAEWIEKSGLTEEAGVLKRELMARYAWSREASLIRSEVQQSPIP